MTTRDGQAVSPVSGTHCSHLVINRHTTHGCALLPQDVNEDAASLFVMPAVGLAGVDMANPRMGNTVVVNGAGLIGLGIIAACSHRGCEVIVIDLQDQRLAMAQTLGADHVIHAGREDAAQTVLSLTNGKGADVVFEATGIPKLLDVAIGMCRAYGKFVFQGNYGEKPIALHCLPIQEKRLTTYFPCDDGGPACRRAILKNIASGALPWNKTITHHVQANDACDFYHQINQDGGKDIIGAVIHWSA